MAFILPDKGGQKPYSVYFQYTFSGDSRQNSGLNDREDQYNLSCLT